MDAIASIKEQLSFTRSLMLGTMEDTTEDLSQWLPAGKAHSIASSYAHLILSEDGIIHGMLQGKQPLAATEFAGKTGVSSMPPQGSEGSADWSDWATTVRVDLDAAGRYYKAVAAATDAYIDSLSESDLERQLPKPVGSQSVNYMLGVVVAHLALHGGEISACKGLQGFRGYLI